jgi:aspartate aminotransferase
MDADPAVLKNMIVAFNNRRRLVLTALNEMDGVRANVPVGAFYVFPDVSSFFGSLLTRTQSFNNLIGTSILTIKYFFVCANILTLSKIFQENEKSIYFSRSFQYKR